MSKHPQPQIADMRARYHELYDFIAPENKPTLEQYANYIINRGEEAETKPMLIVKDMRSAALSEEGSASLMQNASAGGVEESEGSVDFAGLNSSVNDCDIPQE